MNSSAHTVFRRSFRMRLTTRSAIFLESFRWAICPTSWWSIHQRATRAFAISFRREGQARLDHLRLGRHWECDPFQRRAIRLSAGIEGVHVPFRGAPEAYTEVMTGRVDFFFGALTSALSFIRGGKLQALAVSTPKRASALPDVPTTLEAGFADSDYTFWVAILFR